jgi:enoyl-[acyl-carrier protein] reductase III
MRALITGGSKGIGQAVTLALGRSGAEVAINYNNDLTAAEATAREVEAAGGRARIFQADACSLDGISDLSGEIRSAFGELDLLVHCAVTPYGGAALSAPEEDFRDSIEKNGLAFLWIVRACQDLLTAGSSAIFLSSGGATRALPNYAPIGIAKALAEAIVRYLALELAPHRVRVNAVSAAAVDTEALRAVMAGGVAEKLLEASAKRNPSGRALQAADVAGAILALASENASMIQGQVVRVDGGLGLL